MIRASGGRSTSRLDVVSPLKDATKATSAFSTIKPPTQVLPLSKLQHKGANSKVPEHLTIGDRTKVGELTIAGTLTSGYAGSVLGGEVISAQAGQATTVVPKGMLMKQGRYGQPRYYFEVMMLQTAARVTVGVVDMHFLSRHSTAGQGSRVKTINQGSQPLDDADHSAVGCEDGGGKSATPAVGEDCHSWGICGHRSQHGIKHNNQLQTPGHVWKPGDVVGVLVDLARSHVIFSLNGKEVGPAGWNVSSAIVTPALTCEYGSCVRLNLGNSGGFWFPPGENVVAASLRAIEMQREWFASSAAKIGSPQTIANAENVELLPEDVSARAPGKADAKTMTRIILKENRSEAEVSPAEGDRAGSLSHSDPLSVILILFFKFFELFFIKHNSPSNRDSKYRSSNRGTCITARRGWF